MPVVMKFIPRKTDLMMLGYGAIRSRPVVFYIFIIFFIIIPWLLSLLIFVLGAVLGDTSQYSNAFILFILPPIMVSFFFFYAPIRQYANAPSLKGERIYEFSEENIHVTGPGFDNTIEWSLITKFIDVHGFILIFSNHTAIIWLPRRAIPDSTRTDFIALLKSKVQKSEPTHE